MIFVQTNSLLYPRLILSRQTPCCVPGWDKMHGTYVVQLESYSNNSKNPFWRKESQWYYHGCFLFLCLSVCLSGGGDLLINRLTWTEPAWLQSCESMHVQKNQISIIQKSLSKSLCFKGSTHSVQTEWQSIVLYTVVPLNLWKGPCMTLRLHRVWQASAGDTSCFAWAAS